MRTVIMHFFNEEYLLPWWLLHHVPKFDHGILIDYGSTDASVEICRMLAPSWRIVRSRNLDFSAIECDFEVMQYEAELPGWKIALNVTEFLHNTNLSVLEQEITRMGRIGCLIPAAIMVDPFPDQAPQYQRPLVAQKYHGFRESEVNVRGLWGPNRSRLYHCARIGAYAPGRHHTHLAADTLCHGGDSLVLWFGFSPWVPEFLARKLQIKDVIPKRDVQSGFGYQHMAGLSELEQRRTQLLPHMRDLSATLGLSRDS